MSLLEIRDLRKHFKVLKRKEGLMGAIKDLFSGDYRVVKAVDCISFSIEEGEIVGFLGPNGAGKSTTIKMLIGALVPTSGEISVDGFIPYKDRKAYVRNIGIVFGQRSQLWWDIPVIESYRILKEIYGVSSDEFNNNMNIFQSLGDFKGLLNTPVRHLSLGQRTLCDILAVFLHNPKVVFLDEPTIGLDVSIKSEILELIKKLNRVNKTTIILTSHDIGDIECLAERIIMIDKGSIIYDGKTDQFHKLFGAYRVLKVKLPSGTDGVDIESTVLGLFHDRSSINAEYSGHGWVDITFNEEEIPVVDIMKLLLKEMNFVDIKVDNVRLSDLVKRAYEGAIR